MIPNDKYISGLRPVLDDWEYIHYPRDREMTVFFYLGGKFKLSTLSRILVTNSMLRFFGDKATFAHYNNHKMN